MRRTVILSLTGLLITSLGGCLLDESESESETEGELRRPDFAGHEVWVTSQKNGTENIIDDDGHLVATVNVPGAGPHITTFPPSNRFAYLGGMLDGKVYVIDANNHSVVTTLQVGPSLAHQVKPSPDGKTLLVSVISSQSVVKIAADERNRTWNVVGSVSTSQFGKPPICAVFRNDGRRAYVTLNPSGIAIVDVPTMTIVGSIDTDGFIACGMIKSVSGSHAVLAASGSGGHIYNLDLNTGALFDRGTLGAASWHTFIMTPDERLGFGTSPLSDEVVVIDLSHPTARKVKTIVMQPIAGLGNDQPDALGGGELLTTPTMAVSLRAAGKIGFIDVSRQQVISYLDIAAPNPGFNPATCQDCAVHGVTVRPR